MNSLRIVRYVLWGVVAVAAVTVGLIASNALRGTEDAPLTAAVEIGAPFALVTQTGEPISDAHLNGHPSLMFFGYTHCPDVCPAALAEVTAWLAELGPEADDLTVYFVTVDPERDRPELLGPYLTAFDPRIVGITGPVDDVRAMLASYHVFYEQFPDDNIGYLMNHYTSFYMLDGRGEFAGAVTFDESRDEALRKIRRLIANG